MVWKKVNGDDKISHHHSSVRPGAPDMTALARVSASEALLQSFLSLKVTYQLRLPLSLR